MENNYIIFNQSGRFGNAVFRYMAYIMLQKNNNIDNKFKYILDTEFSKLSISPYINDEVDRGIYVKNTKIVNEDNFFNYINIDNPNISKLPDNINISLHGYFQYDHIYLQNKSYILEFLEEHKNVHEIRTDNETYLTKHIIDDMLLDSSKIYENVIHIRLGDFNGRPDFIESEYLLRLFDNIKDIFYNKTAIVIETPTNESDIKYLNTILEWFKENNIPVPVIESNDMLTDYNIMKQAKRIISSMSTLCWVAAYFSKSLEKIYMPNYNFFDIEDRKNGYFKMPIQNTILYDVKTTKFTDIKVVILTLEKYSHRMNKVYELINKLSQIGLQCSLFYGVNGEDIQVVKMEHPQLYRLEYKNESKYYNSSIRVNKQFMKRGELGASWSHINIYKSLLKEKHVDKYLIFEDDAEFVESLEYAYDCLINIPIELDVCHVAKSDWYKFIFNNKVNEFWNTVHKQYFNRLTAYITSKEGAKKILNYTKDSINVPCDDLLSNMHLSNKLNVYVPDKYIFHEPENTISITLNINS
jgi:GR25 family glycosyltransferase involved in LPS biosynthesis